MVRYVQTKDQDNGKIKKLVLTHRVGIGNYKD